MPDAGFPHMDMSVGTLGGIYYVMSMVYEPLINFGTSGFNDVTLVPSLAEKWQISDDARTVTLQLRKGVRWHNLPPLNGREFTSEDVAWNAKYYVENSAFKFLWDPVARVETPDKYTVVLHLKEPTPSFVATLAHRNNYMYPREIFEQDKSFKQRAAGTGPFMVSKFDPDQSIVLVRNPHYWQVSEIDGKPLPYLDRVEGYTIKDYTARMASLRSGQIDQEYTAGTMKLSDVGDFRKLGYTILEGTAVFTRDLLINTNDPLWQDKRVRQAALLAVDRQRFIDNEYEGAGTFQDFVPIDGWGWSADLRQQRLARNLDKARQLLTEAGKLGAKVTITTYKTTTVGLGTNPAQLVANDLKEAGFDVQPLDVAVDAPSLVSTRINPGKFQALIYVHGANGVVPEDYLSPLMCSTKPSGGNYGRVCDAKLDEMINTLRSTVDEAARKRLVNQIQDYLYEEALLVPIAQPIVYKVRNPKIKGPGAQHATFRAIGIERVWIDQ